MSSVIEGKGRNKILTLRYLSDYIKKNGLGPGDRLPSQSAVAEASGLPNRYAPQPAWDELRDRGIISSSRGKGTYLIASFPEMTVDHEIHIEVSTDAVKESIHQDLIIVADILIRINRRLREL